MGFPVWRSHKEVQAFQIANIHAQEKGTHNDTREPLRYIGGMLVAQKTEYVLTDETGEFVAIVGDDYVMKHEPSIGGYFVRYENGYESFSTAAAFEDGYSKGARKRLIHLQVGSDDWQPTQEDLEELTKLFMAAMDDPSGAVIATHADFVISEIVERGTTDDHVLLTCEVTPIEEYVYTPEPEVNWRTIVVWPVDCERKTVAWPLNAIHVENSAEMRDIHKVRGNSVNRIILRGGLVEEDVVQEMQEVLYFATRTHTLHEGTDVEYEVQP